MQSLARYHLVLGEELGGGTQIWRWEYWKESPEGSFRAWTNPSNVIFGLVALTLPSAALWFGFPAVWNAGGMLRVFWGFSFLLLVSFVVLVVYLGIKYIERNNVARPLETKWERLRESLPRERRWLRWTAWK